MGCWLSLGGFVCVAVGLLNALAPRAAWDLTEGWRYENLEPSDLNLAVRRVGGVFSILIGIGLWVAAVYAGGAR